MTQMKVGLVLSGGGAKGAYQVGVVKALRESGTQVDMVAGASIGALNGAVLAAAPSFATGVDRLDELWAALQVSSPLAPNIPAYLSLLVSSGLHLQAMGAIDRLAGLARQAGLKLPLAFTMPDVALLSNAPLHQMMDRFLRLEDLQRGLPLHVSLFRSESSARDLVRVAAAELGLVDTPESEFVHVQGLEPAQQRTALMASAAIPLLFSPGEVNGRRYSDGGQGGWQKAQGNTPIAPLLQAGCNLIVVTHLSDGSVWSRHDFPDATILEIRPQSSIGRHGGPLGGAVDLLGFDAKSISGWIEQGYQDTVASIGPLRDAIAGRQALRDSENLLIDSERAVEASRVGLSIAMDRLR